MMHYRNTQAARKGIMSQKAINELSREHCGAGVGTLTMVVVGALVLGVALTVLGGCGYTPLPRLTDGLEVRYLPLHLCEVPAIVYVAPGATGFATKNRLILLSGPGAYVMWAGSNLEPTVSL